MSYYTPLSFWEKDTWLSDLDVVVVGGGIVGMNAALHLIKHAPKLKIAIVERSSLGTAASSRNAGFACFGSPSEVLADLSVMSADEVYNLIERRFQGLNKLRSIVGDEYLQYLSYGGHEVFLDGESFDFHVDALEAINKMTGAIDPRLKYYKSSGNKGVRNIAGIISNDWEGQIHPGNMMNRLRQLCAIANIRVLTNLEVQRIESTDHQILHCGDISIRSKKVIVCTNGFAGQIITDKTPSPGRNLVLLTSSVQNLEIRGCYHLDEGYVYFRNVGDRILIGGGRNRDTANETTDQFGTNNKIKDYLTNILNNHVLHKQTYTISEEWSGILGFNNTKSPIVKEQSNGLYMAVGLGGMGIAIGTLVGQEVADLLLQS